MEQNHFCNFGRRHHEEQFCEIILNLDPWFSRRCRLKILLICSSCGLSVQRSGTICAILVEVIKRNNSVKFLCNFNRGYQEEQFSEIILNLDQWFRRCHLKDLSGALVALVFSILEPFMQFW